MVSGSISPRIRHLLPEHVRKAHACHWVHALRQVHALERDVIFPRTSTKGVVDSAARLDLLHGVQTPAEHLRHVTAVLLLPVIPTGAGFADLR